MPQTADHLTAHQKLAVADAVNELVEKNTPDNETAVDVLLLALRARLSEFEYRVALKHLA